VGSRGGFATGPEGTVAGRSGAGIAAGAGGTVAGYSRAGAAVGAYGLSGYTARGGWAAGRYGTRYVSAGTLHAQGAYVRDGFSNYHYFTPNWYAAHPNAWSAATWAAPAAWAGATWGALATTCGYPAQPVLYDYGSSVVYQGDQVYYNGDPVASAADYAQQASDIAAQTQQAEPSDKEEWIPLGVFGMVQGEEKDANDLFQLAISKQGILRGNYYNALTDSTVPVAGAVDKQTQRAAWTVGDRKEPVYETGIANLTQPESSLLVHFGKDRTQQWTLVRLEKPDDQK
jgi:hypothetical protein